MPHWQAVDSYHNRWRKTERHIDSLVWRSRKVNVNGEQAKVGCFGPPWFPQNKPNQTILVGQSPQTNKVDWELQGRVQAEVYCKSLVFGASHFHFDNDFVI